jgi:CubicO group peptidase (beta-lactamase class C family)
MRKGIGLIALIVVGVCFAAAVSVQAQEDEGGPAPATLADLDARLAEAFKKGGIPGASVAIVENGRVVLAKGYGLADVAARTPATADTVFRAGSISKSLTGIAVMTAVEDGKLSLDARLADLAPEVKFQNPWEATDPVRLMHLLEHTTGWPDISFAVLLAEGKGWPLLRGVQQTSPEYVSRWKPGLHMVYNNAGPAVAGYVLEKVSGQTFDAYVRDRVLRPMGMATGDFDLPPELAARLARSYGSDGSSTPYQYIILAPAGSLAVSARELAQLVLFFLGRGTIEGHRILAPGSVERIERVESTMAGRAGLGNGYGFGNAPLFDQGITFRGHNGGIDSFTSVYGYSLRNNSGYVMMANGGDGVNFATPTSRMVQAYLTRGMPLGAPPARAIDQGELERLAGVYRPITPSNDMTRPFQEIVGLTRVSAGNGRLRISGNDFFPAGPHTFRRADRDEPSLAFVEEGGETFKLSDHGSQQKEPLWRVAVIAVVLGLLALGLLISAVMLPVWLIAWARGRLAGRGGALVRFLPAGAVLTLAATLILPLLVIASGSNKGLHQLGAPSLYSITILVCSVLFPLLAALGLWRSLRAAEARTFVRWYAGLTCVAVLVFAGYAAAIGWVGVRTWVL